MFVRARSSVEALVLETICVGWRLLAADFSVSIFLAVRALDLGPYFVSVNIRDCVKGYSQSLGSGQSLLIWPCCSQLRQVTRSMLRG